MEPLYPFATLRTPDQWYRAAHRDTAVDAQSGAVELAWDAPRLDESKGSAPEPAAGLAMDQACRIYRSMPAEGRVVRWRWKRTGALDPEPVAEPVDVVTAPAPTLLGDFEVPAPPPALREPRGLAVDEDARLFVAESGADRVLVFDLWSRRLIRRVLLGTGARPLGLACRGRVVWAALEGSPNLVRFSARGAVRPVAGAAALEGASRVAVSSAGQLLVLLDAGGDAARVVSASRPSAELAVPRATDLAFVDAHTLVVARYPGEDFRRFRLTEDGIVEMEPLAARGYLGEGILITPDGRVGYWTVHGFRHAVAARVQYARDGQVTTYRLDSGAYQTVWGRLLLDACIPRGTDVQVSCAAADEVDPDEPTLPRTAPENLAVGVVPRPDLSPPMPPLSILPLDTSAPGVWDRLHRRESGRELPWSQPPAGDPFETYEAPILAERGRFLWITIRLIGNGGATPRVRMLRAEHPSHDYLRRLPKTYSREATMESFLRRYLAIFEGTLRELDQRSEHRDALLDPHAAPAEVLPWLAGFLGLQVDERWPENVLRQLIAEAAWLFRFRGTVAGLQRFLEIYLGVPVIILEKFRLRGIGGRILGDDDSPLTRPVLGAGFRIGGAIGTGTGDAAEQPLGGSLQDVYAHTAHRFSVLIPGSLSPEQLAVVQRILDVHRPAHTAVDVCTAGSGIRVGNGLHVGISSIIGPTGGFDPVVLNDVVLGRASVLGRPQEGTRLDGFSLGSGGGIQ